MSDKRPCPVCKSTHTGAVFTGRVSVPYPRRLTYDQTRQRQPWEKRRQRESDLSGLPMFSSEVESA